MKQLLATIFCGHGTIPSRDSTYPLDEGIRNLLYFWILASLLYIAVPVYPHELTTLAISGLFAGPIALIVGSIGYVKPRPASCWVVITQRVLRITVSIATAYTLFIFFRGLCLLWMPGFDLYWLLITGVVLSSGIFWNKRLRVTGLPDLFTPVLLYAIGFAIVFYNHYSPYERTSGDQSHTHTMLSQQVIRALPKTGNSVIYDLRTDNENHLMLASLKSRWDGYLPVTDTKTGYNNGFMLLNRSGRILDFLPWPTTKGCSRPEDILLFPENMLALTFISERSKPHSLVLIGYKGQKLTIMAKKSTADMEPIGMARVDDNTALVLFSNARVWKVSIRPFRVLKKGGWTHGSPFADKIAISRKLGLAFITFRSGGVGMIALSDLSGQGRLPIHMPTSAILIKKDGKTAYISAYKDSEIIEVDLTDGQILRRARAPSEPRYIAVDPVHGILAVSGYADGMVCVYGTKFLMPRGCVRLGGLARSMFFTDNHLIAASASGVFDIDITGLSKNR